MALAAMTGIGRQTLAPDDRQRDRRRSSQEAEASYTNFILNCPPNRQGLLDQGILDILTQVGSSWTPDASRAPLPAQVPLNEHPYMPTGATATVERPAMPLTA